MAQLRDQTRTGYFYRLEPERVFTGWFFATVIFAVVFGIATLFYADDTAMHDKTVDTRVQIAHMVNQHEGEKRQAVAESILWENDNHPGSFLSQAFGTAGTADFVSQLQSAASEGASINVSAQHADWHEWRIGWLRWTLVSLAAVWMAIAFLVYTFETTEERNEYLMDLPWRRVWPVFFVLLTALPIGAPFYIVSAVRTFRARKRARNGGEALVDQVLHEYVDRHLIDDDDYDYDFPEPEQPRVSFFSAPGVAKTLYVEMRTGYWAKRLERQRQEAVADVEDSEDTLRYLGSQISEQQGRRNKALARQRELENIEPDEAPPLEHVDDEFARLMQLPGVEGVRVVSGEISLMVCPRPEFGDVRYDFGDWELRFGGNRNQLYSRQLRSGAVYPGNEFYRAGDGFCFGGRMDTIHENLLKGQFLQAIEVAVNCMHSVNPGHAGSIPSTYRRATA
jgi:uncharacterized membrane protein